MEFNEVLEKRRTYRDYTNREVSDEIVKHVATAETGGTKLAELLRFSLVCRGEYAPCSNE